MRMTRSAQHGFTLIELSIVLVIIGLIVGGILVGENLTVASQVRATVTQVERYNTAANTFRGEYGYLPGDIPDPAASSFGFQARGTCSGEGDGNGLVQPAAQCNGYVNSSAGEEVVFWVDLSTAHLIDGGFNTAKTSANVSVGSVTPSTTPNLDAFFPAAKLGRGNYFYVYPGGQGGGILNGLNYYGLSALTLVGAGFYSKPALTPQEAYGIDSKIDDGLPISGRVTAQYLDDGYSDWEYGGQPNTWGAGTSATFGTPYTGPTAGSSTSCYDNSSTASGTPGISGATLHYSLEISNGANVTCALSFQMQAGD
jgi:prepilin-type N-terminal cleavage/methylation domain-containing protein